MSFGQFSGRFAGSSGQPTSHASPAKSCTCHSTLPVARSRAIRPSEDFAAGDVYASPVPMYRALRFGSMVGEFHTPDPDGPHNSVPMEFLRNILGFSGIV